MSKAIVGMIPFAIGLVGIGVAIWWSLSREIALGRWLLGGFLVAHGLVHLLFFVPAPAQATGGAEWPFDLSRSWLVTGAGLDDGAVRLVGMALVVVVAAGFLLSGLATVGVLVPSGWWPVLVAASAVASALTLALFFDPQLVLGLGIDALLVWVVLASVWTPAAAVSSERAGPARLPPQRGSARASPGDRRLRAGSGPPAATISDWARSAPFSRGAVDERCRRPRRRWLPSRGSRPRAGTSG